MISGSFGVPSDPPFPAPPGKHWTSRLVGNGFGGARLQWDLVSDSPVSNPVVGPPITSPGPVPVFGPVNTPQPAPTPPHAQVSFDTIGQTIFRSIGTVRLPLRLIWVQGIDQDHPDLPDGATTVSFAAALCEPIDITEEGDIGLIFDGHQVIYDSSLSTPITPPANWTADAQAQLLASLAQITLYPGDEEQEPDPLILADKGAAITNAFRRIRYIVVPDYPIIGGDISGSNPIPRLSVTFNRTNTGESPNSQLDQNDVAVVFAAGSG